MSIMMKMKSFVLFGAIALGALSLTTGCSDKDDSASGNAWDAGKIAGDIVGTWYGEEEADDVFTIPSGKYAGKKIYANKEVQAFQFNADGTGMCYKFLCNVAGEPIDLFGGRLDTENGRFTYTTNADSTITLTRIGNGNAKNPKVWQAVLTKEGLKAKYGTQQFQMADPLDFEKAHLITWEDKLRARYIQQMAETRADDSQTTKIDTVWFYEDEWYDNSFLTDWWHQRDMELSGIGTVHTPWGDENTNDAFDIPDAQRYYNSPSNGWEMCFCKFNDSKSQKIHYFGLYNKWTGTLRVFFYANENENNDYGDELIFQFQSSSNDQLKTPMYHTMTYGIPANHKLGENLLENFDLTGSSGSSCSGWQWHSSPYSTSSSSQGVVGGWHVVDFDMSAWSPYADDWATSAGDNTLFTLRPRSRTTSDLTLTGSLTGSVEGTATTYSEETRTSSSCSEFSDFYNVFSNCVSTLKQVGAQVGSGNGGWMNASKDKTGGAGKEPTAWGEFCGSYCYFCAGLSLVDGIFGMIDDSLQETETYVDSTMTNISMTVDGTIDLSGEVQSWGSVRDGGVDVKYNLMQKSNEDCTIGSGLWSLNDDPVIYICKEDLLSTQEHYNIGASSSGLTLSDFDETETRLVWFLDPSSIKININDDVYHNPRNVWMYVGAGIKSDQDLGHTDCYRDLLCLDDRPTFKISKSTSGTVKLSNSSNPRLTVLDPEDYKAEFNEAIQDDFTTESVDDSRTFNVTGPMKDFNGFHVMLFPEIYVPYNGSTIDAVEAPDLYVFMEIVFDCDEGEGVDLVKHFIPKIELCTRSEMSSKYDEIKEYVDKASNSEAVNTLNYPENVNVYDIAAPTMFKPMLYVMKEVLGK